MRQDAWKSIDEHPLKRLDELFSDEGDRLSRLAHDVAGLYFDWSKTHLDEGLIEAFAALAEKRGLPSAREALFAGEIVNPTEARPAGHVAERGSGDPQAVELASSRRLRMRALVDAIEVGAFGDVSSILHIGIGGSVLGPALLVDALGRSGTRVTVSFLSNIDPQAFEQAVETLDPATTLVVVASKTFTTAETLANSPSRWMGGAARIAGGVARRSDQVCHRASPISISAARNRKVASWRSGCSISVTPKASGMSSNRQTTSLGASAVTTRP